MLVHGLSSKVKAEQMLFTQFNLIFAYEENKISINTSRLGNQETRNWVRSKIKRSDLTRDGSVDSVLRQKRETSKHQFSLERNFCSKSVDCATQSIYR